VQVESVKYKKKKIKLIPIDTVMEDGEPRSNEQIVGAVRDLPTHSGRKRTERMIPTIMEVAMYLKNNPKYEYTKNKEMRIWKMKI
jgi:hypothetical protein